MTATLILSCILWVKGDLTTLLETPISEYGIADFKQEKSGYQFQADVIEERVNSLTLTHMNKDVSTTVYSYESPQRTLYTKLNVGAEEASLSCEINKK
jgi:hypothetical protein